MRATLKSAGLAICLSLLGWTTASISFALAPGRHYEMVSPPFKGGFAVSESAIVASLTGEAVAFASPGDFAEAPSGYNPDLDYIARRSVSGWSTEPAMPPATVIAEPLAADMTTSLDRVMEAGAPGPSKDSASEQELKLELHETDLRDLPEFWSAAATLTHAANGEKGSLLPAYESASASLCQVLLSTPGGEGQALVREAIGTPAYQLYQVGLGCDREPTGVSLVGVNNGGATKEPRLIHRNCDTRRGGYGYVRGASNYFNSLSSDGSEVFFTICTKVPRESGETSKPNVPHQLFVRLGGKRTVEVSRPIGECAGGGEKGEVPCQGAEQRASADFQGASEDGSHVYFTAGLSDPTEPLVPGDVDTSTNLYVATIGCPGEAACSADERVVRSLGEASHDPTEKSSADVMGTVRIAPDGSRAYFVAGGDLLSSAQQSALETQGLAVPQVGSVNLYVFDDTTQAVGFIGTLCTGSLESGVNEDSHCPAGKSDESLWDHAVELEAQTGGPHGEFLVFATEAQLSGSDTNTVRDIYRYDALDGQITRVSGGENGADDNGNKEVLVGGAELGSKLPYAFGESGTTNSHLYEDHEMTSRAISEDGSRIVFTSAEPLSPNATNGLENAYEWREGGGAEGSVSLVSGGTSEQPVKFNKLTISPSGENVFFVTAQKLSSQDTDELNDVYDARIGPGFGVAAAPALPCSSDACQGPLVAPAAVLVPGSATQAGSGNFPAPVKPKIVKKRKARCGKGRIRVRNKCVKHKARKTKVNGRRTRG
jgi:hypothetical protein